jgi:hypothetical protein
MDETGESKRNNLIISLLFVLGLYPLFILLIGLTTTIFKNDIIPDIFFIITFLVIPLIVVILGWFFPIKFMEKKDKKNKFEILFIIIFIFNFILLLWYVTFIFTVITMPTD